MERDEMIKQLLLLQNNIKLINKDRRASENEHSSLNSNIETTASSACSTIKWSSAFFQNKKVHSSFYIPQNCQIEREGDVRRDAFGVSIVKGGKEHRVSFIDNISRQKLVEITEVTIQETAKKEKVIKCDSFICSIL